MFIDNNCFDYTLSGKTVTLKFRNSEAYNTFSGLVRFTDPEARIKNPSLNIMVLDSGLLDFVCQSELLPKGTKVAR